MSTQGWALSHHMFICGRIQDRSSSVPALIQTRSGVIATSLKMGEPQAEQNSRVTGHPLAPTLSKAARLRPSIHSSSLATATRMEKADPVPF